MKMKIDGAMIATVAGIACIVVLGTCMSAFSADDPVKDSPKRQIVNPLPTTPAAVPTTASPATPSVSPSPSPRPTSARPVPPVVVKPPVRQRTQAPPPPAPPAPEPPPPPREVYYRNCDAARAAGAAPLYRGQPGYRSGLDRDDDGVACEVE